MPQSLRVYGDIQSGNCYKVKLLLSLLGIAHDWIHIDILSGAARTEDFKRMNPVGKIPTVQLPDGEFLFESNAILNYLATGTPYLPDAALPRARVLQWQFFEQYNHEPGVAVARFIRKFLGLPDDRREAYEAARAKGDSALAIMERYLATRAFFVDDAFTIADISLHAYTHVAEEGGFDLSQYPAINAWLARVAAQPGFVSMAQFAAA